MIHLTPQNPRLHLERIAKELPYLLGHGNNSGVSPRSSVKEIVVITPIVGWWKPQFSCDFSLHHHSYRSILSVAFQIWADMGQNSIRPTVTCQPVIVVLGHPMFWKTWGPLKMFEKNANTWMTILGPTPFQVSFFHGHFMDQALLRKKENSTSCRTTTHRSAR